MKRHENIIVGVGEYTYTSELRNMENARKNVNEMFGYFHPSNVHNGSDDRQIWDKIHIRSS